MIRGFREFLLRNNVLALAIAVIMGAAVGKVVSSLVQDMIMPVLSPLLSGGSWREAKMVLGTTVGPDGKSIENAIHYGTFAGTILDFLIVALIVYLITRALLKEPPGAPTKPCPRCKETIALEATKCKFCTADI
jgi:large conductance mechanosensitive channel